MEEVELRRFPPGQTTPFIVSISVLMAIGCPTSAARLRLAPSLHSSRFRRYHRFKGCQSEWLVVNTIFAS